MILHQAFFCKFNTMQTLWQVIFLTTAKALTVSELLLQNDVLLWGFFHYKTLGANSLPCCRLYHARHLSDAPPWQSSTLSRRSFYTSRAPHGAWPCWSSLQQTVEEAGDMSSLRGGTWGSLKFIF